MSKHLFLTIAVSVLALLFLDPFMLLMPESITWLVLGCLMLATLVYGLLIFTEKANDEREVAIRGFADRVSCLVGMMFLVMIIAMDFFHPWQSLSRNNNRFSLNGNLKISSSLLRF